MTSESLVKNHDYGLTVVDIMLPGKDSFALLPESKSYEMPVIFLTARGELLDRVKGLTGGAEDYMIKPFEMLELLVRINKILERFQQKEPEIHIKNIVINPKEKTVTREGQGISSEPMELNCLMMLARNRNKTLTRKQFLTVFWLLFRGPVSGNL